MHAFLAGRLFNFDHFSGNISRDVSAGGRAALRNGRRPARSSLAKGGSRVF
jgi:hypothetical protein